MNVWIAKGYLLKGFHSANHYNRVASTAIRCFATDAFKPKDIVIPLDRVDTAFSRSSGPGGQNVNKVNTKAEIRFVVEDADWIPSEVRKRLMEYQMNKINSNGELVVSSQQHRTQSQNKEDCVKKLQEMLADAYLEPKERKMYEEISEQNKSHRRVEKRKRSEVKSNRRVNKDDY